MQTTTKAGTVVFEHNDEFKGDVTITRNKVSITVPMEALRLLVAESVRHDLAAHIVGMKPADLLRRIA